MRDGGILEANDKFGFPFGNFPFRIPNSTKMPAVVPDR